jgi:UDP:flavonoid glycosyltransferase YjiC (YdhE family)
MRAVLLVGRHPGADQLRAVSSDVFVAEYAPHAALFARASIVVHHGGVGTTAQAMRAGKPMLVVPHAHDQPDNAFRISRLGAGLVLDAARYKSAGITTRLRRLTADRSYAARASDIGRVVSAEAGADVACRAMLAACL